MPGLVYVDQTATALRLTCVEGRIDTRQFHVLAEQELDLAGGSLRAGIIGASHYLVLDTPSGAISEVLACVDVEAGAARVEQRRITDRALDVTASRRTVEYTFRGSRGRGSELEARARRIERAAHQIAREGGGIGMVEAFPAGPDGRVPKTIVLARASSGGHEVRVETVHAYPHEDAVVLTESRFVLATSRSLEED